MNAEICKQRAVFHANSAKQGLVLEVNAWKSIIMSLLALRILGEGQLQFVSPWRVLLLRVPLNKTFIWQHFEGTGTPDVAPSIVPREAGP